MLKNTFFILIFLASLTSNSQEKAKDSVNEIQSPIVNLRGQIISGTNKKPLSGVHIFNMTSVRGSVSNREGYFISPAKANDTLFLSHLGYQSVKIKVTNDLLKGNELEITLHEKAEVIEEVKVKTIQLVGVLEIDAKNVPQDKYTRIHINGLPQTYEVGAPKRSKYSSPVAAIFHPVDFVYNMFGKNPKQLNKLKKMKDDNEIRDMLDSKVNRELMLEYLELSREELNELLDECNYSEYFIRTASDIQVIEAVIECYENYRANKQGTTKRK